MKATLRSFAKINLGLRIGAPRSDGFHDLLTLYQTIALHDVVSVSVEPGSGIEIRCEDSRVPKGDSNTCYRTVERAAHSLHAKGRFVIEIEKRLPVQGGLGGASANGVAAMLALEKALRKSLAPEERFRIAAEVGSDVPLFLIGGTVLGIDRGEQVYPVEDLPPTPCVVVAPQVGVSTPKAFAAWDLFSNSAANGGKLTLPPASDRMVQLSRAYSAWLSGRYSGAPIQPRAGGSRAENPLLALVRAGIMNDFEQVVFPEYPELSEAKRALLRAAAIYASLSGSGSALFGLFRSRVAAVKAAARLRKQGLTAHATTTLTRRQYWRKVFDC